MLVKIIVSVKIIFAEAKFELEKPTHELNILSGSSNPLLETTTTSKWCLTAKQGPLELTMIGFFAET